MARSNEAWLRFAGVCLPILFVSLGAHSALKAPKAADTLSPGIPTADEFVSLAPYLVAQPAKGVPVIGSMDRMRSYGFDPFASADFVQEAGSSSSSVPAPQLRDRYVVTAILISRDKRVAVINEAVVGIGSILPGGVRVIAIENDHVEIVAPSGSRRMLAIKDSNGP